MMIAVTGIGAITSLGRTAAETFDRLVEGKRGFRDISLFDPGDVRSRLVGEVSDLELPHPERETVSRTSELALIAAREAIADASLDIGTRRVGLVLGGSTAGMLETESILATLLSTDHETRKSRPPPPTNGARQRALAQMLSHPLSAPTDRLALTLGPFVRVRSLSSACSSGANALLVGATWLELGLVDAVVCGAADSLCRVTVSGFNALAALDPGGARPFDVRRRGLTLGEGAGMVVLERAEDAAARSQRARCTLLGWAARAEAHHITNPEASGEAPYNAMQAALARAGLSPADIDYVNAHGTGTPLNDSMETRALGRIFGAEGLSRVPVSSQKGMIGHTLAAAGAIEAVITAVAIERGVLPPTGGLEQIDPECAALHHVLTATPHAIGAAISSSFGFGGMDTALVLGRGVGGGGASGAAAASSVHARRSVVITGVAAVTPAGIFVGPDVADLPDKKTDATAVELTDELLDAEKARRLDRASRIATVACDRALSSSTPLSATGTATTTTQDPTGVVLGIAFGAVDATAEMMRRLRDKGPRMVRPAEFPSLVPSSPAGHASIYLGLTGPALVVADLAASGECAFVQAYELIASGEVDRICAGAVEERSVIVEEVLSVIVGARKTNETAATAATATTATTATATDAQRSVRREGGAAVVLAAADRVPPGSMPLARLGELFVGSDVNGKNAHSQPQEPLSALPDPPERAIVVLGGLGQRAEEIVASSSWSRCSRVICADACGAHEAAGGVAIAVAAAKVARGDAPAALFVGSARGWSYAGTVWSPLPVTVQKERA